MVAVNLWYHVGPANEEKGRTGFAHLFEHMMFQSSKHVPPDTYFKFLEAAGASGINGTTHYDRTNYFQTLPPSTPAPTTSRRCRRISSSWPSGSNRTAWVICSTSSMHPSWRTSRTS